MSDDENRDGRSAVARGYVLASRATSIGLQMAIPAGLGWWVDTTWKTTPWAMITGVVLGFVLTMFELVQFAKDADRADSQSRNRGSDQGRKSE